MGNNKGFSLIEMTFFSALLVAVFCGASSVLVAASTQTSKEDQHWKAAKLGGMVIEELSFSHLSAEQLKEDTYHRYYDNNLEIVENQSDNYTYDVSWVVQANNPIHGVYNIRVLVKWRLASDAEAVVFETFR